MTAWRHILKDRVAGAGLLTILVQLLLFQALVTSFTCSMMSTAQAAQGSAIVICHGAGTETVSATTAPVHRSVPGNVCFDCPCGTRCASVPIGFAAFTPGEDLGPAYTLAAETIGFSPMNDTVAPVSQPLAFKPDPTGPPAFSV